MPDTVVTIKIIALSSISLLLMACSDEESDTPITEEPPGMIESPDGYNGLHGYISYRSESPPAEYNAGIGFYTSVWPLTNGPIANFQIGLPGIWLLPDTRDVTQTPLCPNGTIARDNWPERAPTYGSVFQTIEGGAGYWVGNQYKYASPKFSINGTSQCYNDQIATPGWPFFMQRETLADDQMGLAQLSNRILVPADGMTFANNPDGNFLGYSWMALPLTDPVEADFPIGENSWTLFVNSQNFKGPIAYYLPETWTKVASNFDYEFAKDKGLDKRFLWPGGGGAIEINTVPYFLEIDENNNNFIKLPKLNFSLDSTRRSILVSDYTYFSKAALFDKIKQWRSGGPTVSGSFANSGWKVKLTANSNSFSHNGSPINVLDSKVSPIVVDDYAWGLQWENNTTGSFPEYFKFNAGEWQGVTAEELPDSITLRSKLFPSQANEETYYSLNSAAWTTPGPSSDIYSATLQDGSSVTYQWYRFVDQPAFQQYQYSDEKKQQLQSLIEQMHRNWTIDQEYMPPLTSGSLVSFDPALIVSPPSGLEVGYVPIVIGQQKL